VLGWAFMDDTQTEILAPPTLAVLTIAGSDSGGGAGIQADLRTFSAYGLLGTTAITAITAQNTVGVDAWEPVSARLVAAQIAAILRDLPVKAAKTGMLGTVDIIEAVSASLDSAAPDLPLVVDPVMISTSGHRLLRAEAEEALVRVLIPRALVLTPNLPEAAALSGLSESASATEHAARIRLFAPRAWIVVKGGHGNANNNNDLCVDAVFAPDGTHFEIKLPRVPTRNTHGTGCTLSAAIAAKLALGATAEDAIRSARRFVQRGLEAASPIGAGHGPLNHLFAMTAGIDAVRSL